MGESQVDQLWSDLNADKNDTLSADEAKASDQVQAQWSLLDVDQDGQLSYKEFSMIDLTK
jgi:Ca2+-binding EF-hand superfamily protein